MGKINSEFGPSPLQKTFRSSSPHTFKWNSPKSENENSMTHPKERNEQKETNIPNKVCQAKTQSSFANQAFSGQRITSGFLV